MYVIDDNKAREVAVVTGNELKGQVIVKSGLVGLGNAGEQSSAEVAGRVSVKVKS